MNPQEMLEKTNFIIEHPEAPLAKDLAYAINPIDFRNFLQYSIDMATEMGHYPTDSDIEDWIDVHSIEGSPWRGMAVLETFGTECEGCGYIGLKPTMSPCTLCSRRPRSQVDCYHKYMSPAQEELKREDLTDDYRKKLSHFAENYEDQWDYSHHNINREMSWGFYLRKAGKKYEGPYPAHFSTVPKSEQEPYKRFLAKELSENYWDMTPEEILQTYTLKDAVEECWECSGTE